MKKIILTFILGCGVLLTQAQEKGFYVTAGGSLGGNYFNYKLDGDNCSSPKLGWGGEVGVQYYFTQHWGLATGVGLRYYNTKGNFSSSWENDPGHYSFGNMQDNSGKVGEDMYTMLLGLNNWTETQQAYFLEVPLMVMYQTKWGRKEKVGMYAGLGAKVQIPVMDAKYQVNDDSRLQVLGYYDNTTMQLLLGEPYNIPEQGLGTANQTRYKGDLSLTTSFAGTAELGLLFSLSRRVDLSVGAYFDYGFTDVKKEDTKDIPLVEPTTKLTPSDDMYVGKNIAYNGYMNSYAVDKAGTLAYGGKVGIRIKLGKLKERPTDEELAAEEAARKQPQHTVTETHTSSRDTMVVMYTPQYDTNLMKSLSNMVNSGNNASHRQQPTDEELKIMMEPIFFDLDKDELLPASKITLNRKGSVLERYPSMRLLITGNTCNLGNDTHNIKLGQRRAEAARQYLESAGVKKDRLSTVSESFTHPLMPNSTDQNREKNRRCDFYPTGY